MQPPWPRARGISGPSRGLCWGSWQGDPLPSALGWWPKGIPQAEMLRHLHAKSLGAELPGTFGSQNSRVLSLGLVLA